LLINSLPESYHIVAAVSLHQRLKLLAHVGFLLIGTGVISSYFGDLRVGLLVPLLGSLLLIALQIRAMRFITPQASA
jgi:hypothetical protein